jgi:putative ABC transport system permease protein
VIPSPPQLAEWLMRRSLVNADRQVVLGDLCEEFTARAKRDGVRVARRWYWRQVRRSFFTNLRRLAVESFHARSLNSTEARASHPSFGGDLMRDIRDAIRSLQAAPGFTTVALIVLTLGIGASTAIFSVVDAVILRALPFEEGDRVVQVGRISKPMMNPTSEAAPNFLDWRAQQDVFQYFAASAGGDLTVRSDGVGEPEVLRGNRVTADLFPLLRVMPAMGRTFTAEDEIDGRHHVALISDDLWRRRFGADPAILGKTMTTDNGVWEIVGIMPPGFRYPIGAVPTTEVWLPYVLPAAERVRGDNKRYYLQLVARLKDGVTVEQARARMQQITEPIAKQYPSWFLSGATIGVVPMRDALVSGVRSWMLMLLGAVSLVLLIACVNVANLMLARAIARERELAVRTALGATRWQLGRGLLVESLMLSAIGTAFGVALAWWGVDVLKASMPSSVPRLTSIGIDSRVLIGAAVSAIATGILFGVVPAIRASRADVTWALKDGGRLSTVGTGRQRLRAGLVVAEVALAVMLLVGAGLFLSSFVRVMRIDLGLDDKKVLTVGTSFRVAAVRLDDPVAQARGRALATDMVGRLQQVAGVEAAAAIAGGLPLSGDTTRVGLAVLGRPAPPGNQGVDIRQITPDYFRVLRIPLLRGRFFTDRDNETGQKAVILNDVSERLYFDDQNALGRLVKVQGTDRVVVGIVRGVRLGGPETDVRQEAYVPVAQSTISSCDLVIRTSGDPSDMLPSVKAAIRAVNPNQALTTWRTLQEYFDRVVAQRRFNMQLLGLFGLLGGVIAGVGIYGVMAYNVAQRTQEIGVRMALGALPSQILRNVLTSATAYVTIGLVLGLIGAWGLSGLMQAFLFQVQARDSSVYALVSLTVAAAGLLAAWVPAWRASTVDPLIALRTE